MKALPGFAAAQGRRAPLPQHPRSLPLWLSAAVWLAALLSPTGYVLLVITLCRSQMPAPPGWFVVTLFCLIPVVALPVCAAVAWLSKMSRGWRVGWLLLTVLAMLIQLGVLVIAISSAITAAISPA